MTRPSVVTRLAERPDLPRDSESHACRSTGSDERQPLRTFVQIFAL